MNQTSAIPELADIYGIWHVPFWQTDWFKFCGGIMCIIVIAAIVYSVLHRIKNRRLPELSPWQEALRQLEKMAITLPKTSDGARLHYARLTFLLKRYIQKRYGQLLAGSTDTELAQQAQSHGLPEKATDQLREILEGAVLIKFARAEAREAQIARDLKHARAIITLTTPKTPALQKLHTKKQT